MQKFFLLPRSYDPEKGKGILNDLNGLLADIGVSFSVSKNNFGHRLYVDIDEKRLQEVTVKRAGRPKGYNFDYEKVKEMQAAGMSNKDIYTALGISKSLFYLRMKESKK